MNNKAIASLVAAGADAMKNMYDIAIEFPGDSDGSIVTVRANSFDVPTPSVETYQIKYHGETFDRPKSEITLDRKFTVTFRMDSAYALFGKFVQWQSTVVDHVKGGVSNYAPVHGRVTVTSLSGAYNATNDLYQNVGTIGNNIVSTATSGLTSVGEDVGSTTTSVGVISQGDTNPTWKFYDVWVSKVDQPKFDRESADALEFEVEFHFGDCDYPLFNGKGITGTGDGGITFS